jgi:hypothetical protein
MDLRGFRVVFVPSGPSELRDTTSLQQNGLWPLNVAGNIKPRTAGFYTKCRFF